VAQINLLPWRERLREERKREFVNILVGIVIIAGGLVLLVDRYMVGEIDAQSARNDFVRSEISILDDQVEEISQLRQQKEDIRARMSVITDLQGTRPLIVRMFDELVKTLPNGVYYQTVERVGERIAIDGVAESNAQITELLRNLDASGWFRDPDLSDITAADAPASLLDATAVLLDATASSLTEAFSFSLTVTLDLPDLQEEV
jgi:type IV pilus assembly protein PilN|tara:strand:+ start:408 stop:1019 length:612 start_codon:yes stop_codon:yes gene_type:complete